MSQNGHPTIADEVIRIRGARVHNLKNVDIDLPRNQLVVITGPSGSGKSSLAIDTLFAEGQRQYVESLSAYARQFLHQMERPDVDMIDGLQPTICIDQRADNPNPRSTVATVTEIYDYLRVLMARLGEPHCHSCGLPIQQQTPEEIQDIIQELPEGTKTMILAPMVRGRKGEHAEVFAKIRKAGLIRARVDGGVYDLENLPELNPRKVHHIEAVVDRVIIREGLESRLAESVALAVKYGEGLVIICYLDEEQVDDEHPQGTWKVEIFSTLYACPDCKISYEEVEPRTFSFNSPYGACPVCEGLGARVEFDPELVLPDLTLSLAGGAVAPWKSSTPAAARKQQAELGEFLKVAKLDAETPLADWKPKHFQHLLYGNDKKFLGILMLLEKDLATTTSRKRQAELENYRGEVICQGCQGARLRPEATSVLMDGKSVHQITAMSIEEAYDFFDKLAFHESDQPISEPLVTQIMHRLEFLMKVGVNYLTLDRSSDTLSGGELQRVRLATGIGTGLVGVCYVLDEPSIGLHQRDNQRLIDALRNLQQLGNTVLVVEHDEAMMKQADRLIDVGPGAGAGGGEIISQGTPQEVAANDASITGRYLSGETCIPVPAKRRRTAKARSLTIDGVTTNNLDSVTVRIPLAALVCVTGVSGSGKSSLINETLLPALMQRLGASAHKPGPHTSLRGASQVDKVIRIDQSPIGRTPRSNPATYTGAFDEIRKIYAGTRTSKQRGYGVGRFSFNVKGGRCEECQGQGVQKIEMNFLPDLFVQCPVCNGSRFNRQTLQVRYRDRSIGEVLAMSIAEAADFFENFTAIYRLLKAMCDVGLGYLTLGQRSTTLSGGEAQRIKLATQLARVDTGKTLYLLDEPTTGLHFADIQQLLNVLGQLVDKGNTVVVIEHNLDVIKCADWIIDLGPEGGKGGGQVMATGTPEEVAMLDDNFTGTFLKEMLNV